MYIFLFDLKAERNGSSAPVRFQPISDVSQHAWNVKNMFPPRRGIEPRSPAWQAGILTTILPRNRYRERNCIDNFSGQTKGKFSAGQKNPAYKRLRWRLSICVMLLFFCVCFPDLKTKLSPFSISNKTNTIGTVPLKFQNSHNSSNFFKYEKITKQRLQM